ncbi:MAG: DUF47 domain-containing protein [Mycobacterium leprae]
MMLFRGSNTDQKFFGLLGEASATIVEAGRLFTELNDHLDDSSRYADLIKQLETRGDQYVQGLTNLLNQAFMTPLDREDILSLAQQLDDVLDGIEKAAARMDIYRIREADEHIRTFATILQQQAREIDTAVGKLKERDFTTVRASNNRIRKLEEAADVELRRCLTELFDQPADPIRLTKLKEIYDTLEDATDKAKAVADTLESVVVKNG